MDEDTFNTKFDRLHDIGVIVNQMSIEVDTLRAEAEVLAKELHEYLASKKKSKEEL